MKKQSFVLEKIPRLLARPFRLRDIGWMPDHVFWNRNRVLEHPHFCFTLSREPGVARSLINGKLCENDLPAPMLSIIPAGTRIHTLVPVKHDELYFTVAPEFFAPIMELRPKSGAFRMNRHIGRVLEELFENFNRIYVPGTADRLDGLFVRLLEETTLAIDNACPENEADPLICEIMSFLAVNFTGDVTIEHICRKFSVSRRTLYRRWKMVSDLSPADFLRKKRLELAANLLKNTRMGIQEIARYCGFGNVLYFTQCFRRECGTNPTSWRNDD